MTTSKLNSLEQSQTYAQQFAEELSSSKHDTVILFYAEMGAGKTTLIAELGRALGMQERITSPTFIGMNEYHNSDMSFYHYDLYQVGISLEDFAEILEQDGHKVIAIEWAENLDEAVLQLIKNKANLIKIKIDLDGETRVVTRT
ncbi:MAG: tRNA (adenosine(37)-N6)-threonylcarbamoyltransferase complex ATPase subunit type 1 TsaE [Candidatus Melainabacteria bacterium]|nr:tRNA (adenosine(37)-N6)-threonylcarbamoyltransferase complex ATPase subunit type 1 TsaE [Candidatus Melainabacteria bacterium]